VRVKGWFVEGFGILRDYDKSDLPPGLSVFLGENESGKSTLHDFLRGVLFGFPRGAKKRGSYYSPQRGGRHGGRVFVDTAAGGITVEREVGHPPRIRMDDGTTLTDSEFQMLLGGVDAQMFRTVFAFSLEELRDFDSLSDDQIRARIFAAGVGGAGPSVRGVIQQLDKRAQQALKPRARDARVNGLLAELAACDAGLADARRQAEGYPSLLDEERLLKKEAESVELEERELREVVVFYERLQELWPIWSRSELARERLRGMEAIDAFVADPLGRLAEVRQAIKGAEEASARLEDQRQRRQQEIESLQLALRPELESLGAEVERQAALLPFHEDRVRDLSAARERARQDDDRMLRQLADLGPGFDEASVAAIDASLPRAEEVRQWRDKLADAAEARGRASATLQSATLVAGKAESERNRIAASIQEVEPPGGEVLEDKLAAFRTLRAGLATLEAKRAAIDARAPLLEGTEQLLATESEARAGPGRARGRRSGFTIISIVSATVLVALAVWAGAVGRVLTTVILAAGVVVLLIAAAVLSARGGRSTGRQAGARPGGTGGGALSFSAEAVLARRLEEGRAHEKAEAEEMARLATSLLASAGVLGLVELPAPDELERIEVVLTAQQRESIRWQDQAIELARLEERWNLARLDEGSAKASLAEADDRLSSLEGSFRDRLQEWGLPPTLSPVGAEDFLRATRVVKDQVERRDESNAAVARLGTETSAWEDHTRALLEAAGAEASDPEGPAPALLRLREKCRAHAAGRAKVDAILASLEESRLELDGACLELTRRRQDRQSLLKEAGAADEADFQRRLEVFEERKELLRTIAEAEARLKERVGQGTSAQLFVDALRSGELALWQERLDDAGRLLTEVRARSNDLVKQQGDAERRLRWLEESADVPGIETRLQGLRTELEAALREWRVANLASMLVRETLTEFTLERQPFVLAEASDMFKKVTGGRYERILRSTEEDGVVLVGSDGKAKLPEHLSRGAVEQLYLCLRLGLAEEFSRRTESIPLVMDDVLVNFDDRRRQVTAELLVEFSRRHQVLLFTCHPEVVELLQHIEPKVHVVTMHEGR